MNEQRQRIRVTALIPKQLKGMGVDDVLSLLTRTFDLDYLDTLSEALQKHLKEEETKAPPAVRPMPGVGRVLTPQKTA
jgi:hypothetical protein